MKNFKTEDGYMLHQKTANGFTSWTDNDLSFEDKNGWPVDNTGEKLDGKMLPSTITPLTQAEMKTFRERLARQLIDNGFKEGPYNVLQRGDINVDFKDVLSVRINLSDDGWYGAFESYYHNIDAVEIVNISDSLKSLKWK